MKSMKDVLAIMARLRDPETGCPWDREQRFETIASYTLEEAYEVADAIERRDYEALRGELGDLLFQVVFHAQMAAEAGLFDFDAVALGLAEKLTRRHPHVFGDVRAEDAEAVRAIWEATKAAEREAGGGEGLPPGVLDGVPTVLPALTRAFKLQRRAAGVGFDWPDAAAVWAKVEEELGEVREALDGPDGAALEEEIGDLMFACVNLARHAEVDPEAALRRANAKFERRFREIEARLRETGETPVSAGLERMDALWEAAKRLERGADGQGGDTGDGGAAARRTKR